MRLLHCHFRNHIRSLKGTGAKRDVCPRFIRIPGCPGVVGVYSSFSHRNYDRSTTQHCELYVADRSSGWGRGAASIYYVTKYLFRLVRLQRNTCTAFCSLQGLSSISWSYCDTWHVRLSTWQISEYCTPSYRAVGRITDTMTIPVLLYAAVDSKTRTRVSLAHIYLFVFQSP